MAWKDAELWAVGTDDWGNIETYDPMESEADAREFIRDFLGGRGVIMKRSELATAYPRFMEDF